MIWFVRRGHVLVPVASLAWFVMILQVKSIYSGFTSLVFTGVVMVYWPGL